MAVSPYPARSRGHALDAGLRVPPSVHDPSSAATSTARTVLAAFNVPVLITPGAEAPGCR
jgi:hypothetical protein